MTKEIIRQVLLGKSLQQMKGLKELLSHGVILIISSSPPDRVGLSRHTLESGSFPPADHTAKGPLISTPQLQLPMPALIAPRVNHHEVGHAPIPRSVLHMCDCITSVP